MNKKKEINTISKAKSLVLFKKKIGSSQIIGNFPSKGSKSSGREIQIIPKKTIPKKNKHLTDIGNNTFNFQESLKSPNSPNSFKRKRSKFALSSQIQTPINMLHRIMLLLKIAKRLRDRTRFRSMKFLTKNQAKLIFDETYTPEASHKPFFLKRFTEKNVFYSF